MAAITSAVAVGVGSAALGAKSAKDASKRAANSQREAADTAANAQLEATRMQEERIREGVEAGQKFYEPYSGLGQAGLDNQDFLMDSQAQYDFLMDNPLFQAGLDNANQVTAFTAAGKGRLSAGDTMMDLSKNFATQSQGLIQDRVNAINTSLDRGSSIANAQANLATNQGTQLAGIEGDRGNIGAAQATQIGNAAANQAQQSNAVTQGLIRTGADIATNTDWGGIFGSSQPPGQDLGSTQAGYSDKYFK